VTDLDGGWSGLKARDEFSGPHVLQWRFLTLHFSWSSRFLAGAVHPPAQPLNLNPGIGPVTSLAFVLAIVQ